MNEEHQQLYLTGFNGTLQASKNQLVHINPN